MIQKISSLMQLDLDTHRQMLHYLLRSVLRNLIQVKAQQPQLFADCVKVLKYPDSLAAYKRHEAERSESAALWLKRFYRDHVEA